MSRSEDLTMRLFELSRNELRALLRARPATSSIAPTRTLAGWDWADLAEDANRHNVGVLVRQRIADAGQQDALPAEVAAAWLADARHAALQHGLQLRDAFAVSEELTRAGIRHAFVKGLAYALSLYEPHWLRFGGDVDLLIDRENVETVRQLMRKFHFAQAKFQEDHQQFWPATAAEIRAVENQHYELAEFNKYVELLSPPPWLLAEPFTPRSPFGFGRHGDRLMFCSSIDAHWALHFLFADSRPLDEVRKLDSGLPVLSPEWSLVYSVFKLYVEVFDRPRYGFTHVADIVALLNAGGIDWDRLAQLVENHGLQAAAYYTLSACQELADAPTVPDSLIERWSVIAAPDEQPGKSIDFGPFVPYLAGSRAAVSLGAPRRGVARSKRS